MYMPDIQESSEVGPVLVLALVLSYLIDNSGFSGLHSKHMLVSGRWRYNFFQSTVIRGFV